ncbi:hypothetical protein AURDEDRAFT_175991 [Auricularia subglabra TFB-10046 SS5]|nr:hypothetical protein AURDEDRAFT_175991 [Auricularia subglabra TFB-10046 SS5]
MLLCLCLANCLYGVDKSAGNERTVVKRAQDANKKFRSASGAWPSTQDQLFPYGPERTIEALLDACCAFTDASALWVLRAILRIARPRVWDIILLPENRRRLVWYLMTLFLVQISDSDEHFVMISENAPPGCKVPRNIMDAECLCTDDVLNSVLCFLETVKNGPYFQHDDVLHFVAADAAFITRVLRIAEAHYSATAPHPRALRNAKAYLHILRILEESPVSYAELAHFVEHNPRSRGVLLTIQLAVGTLSADRYCAGPRCGRTMLDADRPLALCARCKLVRYCCKECQRADWNSGHKRLCPLFVVMHTHVLSPDYLRLVEQSALTDESLAALGLWALTRGQSVQYPLAHQVQFPNAYKYVGAGLAAEPAKP